MPAKNYAKIKSTKHFHYLVVNPDFRQLLHGIKLLGQNKKVAFLFRSEIIRNDSFFTTTFFPVNFFEVFGLKQMQKQWQLISGKIPHLIRPRKTLYLNPGIFTRSKARLSDFILQNNYEKKSVKADSKQWLALPFLKANPKKAIYFQEYRINISRLFIECLRFAENKGAEIYFESAFTIAENEVVFAHSNQKFSSTHIEITENKTLKKACLPISTHPGFSLFSTKNKQTFRVTEFENQLDFEFVSPKNRPIQKQEIAPFIASCFHLNNEFKMAVNSTYSIDLKTIYLLLKTISADLPYSFQNTSLTTIDERCNECFDEAKQTGISFQKFKLLFYRYGKAIEELTETAYEKMNETRNPEEIWEKAELDFRQKREWINSEIKLQ